jgi:FAD/FMN-containing dehydrogenase
LPTLPAFQGRLIEAPDDMAPFLVDWRRQFHGRAIAVAQPETTGAVATLVRWCADHRVPIVPQGGNTGLSGGSVPDSSGQALVLSLSRLTRIRAVDPAANTLTAEAGCTLQSVRDAADAASRLYPLSLPSQGSCTIGGNLATNAGGTAVLRYGNARDLCLGLEVVTAQGRIWNGLRALRKDNTGLDLRDLFIGAEGTLGIITAAVLKLFPQPAGTVVALAAVSTPADALRLLAHAQSALGPALTAFELIGRLCLDLVLRHFPTSSDPMHAPSPWYVLLETCDWRDATAARDSLAAMLESALNAGTIADAVMADSLAQAAALWSLREHISDSQAREGPHAKHDISIPIAAIPAFIAEIVPAVETRVPGASAAIFGHLGDGNLHVNILLPPHDFAARQADANRVVHDLTAAYNGSISAEHGLGVLRAAEAARFKSDVEMDLLCAVRTALDPLGIMNPGKGISAANKKASLGEMCHPPRQLLERVLNE